MGYITTGRWQKMRYRFPIHPPYVCKQSLRMRRSDGTSLDSGTEHNITAVWYTSTWIGSPASTKTDLRRMYPLYLSWARSWFCWFFHERERFTGKFEETAVIVLSPCLSIIIWIVLLTSVCGALRILPRHTKTASINYQCWVFKTISISMFKPSPSLQ